MKLQVLDKEIAIESYEVEARTVNGELVLTITENLDSTTNPFMIVCNAFDTRRLINTLSSAVSLLESTKQEG